MDSDQDRNPVGLLQQHREQILAFLRQEGAGLRRYETEEDLLQGLHLHLLEVRDRFEYRGETEALAWLHAVARQFVVRRYGHWKAQRRRATGVLRLTRGGAGGSESVPAIDPAASATGPATMADRRERVLLAMRALRALPERDQKIIDLEPEGLSNAELAERLGIGYEAAAKARGRALDRFRRSLEALDQGRGR